MAKKKVKVEKARGKEVVDGSASKRGDKFTSKYDVSSATIYKKDPGPGILRIPPPGHVLYDSEAPIAADLLMVKEIDEQGEMKDPVEVWTDPDNDTLWVLDGRSRLLAVREVNRIRAREGRVPVLLYLVPFASREERDAVRRMKIKNYHRRIPKPSTYAVDLFALRKRGYTWDDCLHILHVEKVDNAEKWGRRRIPLAHCVPAVRRAVDEGEIPLSMARKFGGGKEDGSARLGDREQEEKLRAYLAERAAPKPPPSASAVTPRGRERLAAALSNGQVSALRAGDREAAEVCRALMARLYGGVPGALARWPSLSELVERAVSPPPSMPAERADLDQLDGG